MIAHPGRQWSPSQIGTVCLAGQTLQVPTREQRDQHAAVWQEIAGCN